MKNTTVQAVGVVWYLPEDYAQIKALMEDGHMLHSSYAGWKAAIEQGEQRARANGVRVYRAVVRPAAFAEWCRARGLKVNAEAREQFANTFAMEEYRAGR